MRMIQEDGAAYVRVVDVAVKAAAVDASLQLSESHKLDAVDWWHEWPLEDEDAERYAQEAAVKIKDVVADDEVGVKKQVRRQSDQQKTNLTRQKEGLLDCFLERPLSEAQEHSFASELPDSVRAARAGYILCH